MIFMLRRSTSATKAASMSTVIITSTVDSKSCDLSGQLHFFNSARVSFMKSLAFVIQFPMIDQYPSELISKLSGR